MIETKDKAKEILNYCITYLLRREKITKKLYKDMVKEIVFMIDVD